MKPFVSPPFDRLAHGDMMSCRANSGAVGAMLTLRSLRSPLGLSEHCPSVMASAGGANSIEP